MVAVVTFYRVVAWDRPWSVLAVAEPFVGLDLSYGRVGPTS